MKPILKYPLIIGVAAIFVSCSKEVEFATKYNSNEAKADAFVETPEIEVKTNSEGEKIFKANCVKCHGIDGKRKSNEAKDLSISTLSMDECIQVISSTQDFGRRFHEPRFPSKLSDNDIMEVTRYILTFRKEISKP